MDDYAPLDRPKATTSSSGRFAFSRSLTFHKSSDRGVDGEKGPLGLTTILKPLQNVVADLIFVHGLGGGSRKTWSKNEDPALFWPQEWLSEDSEFKDVRIHTFGYDSNWDKESILGIHDFAKSLLEWVKDCPSIPREANNPMILICHSLGGLVAKRAYILARQLSEYSNFAKRVQVIFFLATPHRGSNLAELLTRILQITHGARPFVSDLHPNSTTIQSINDEFPHHCQDLQLYSFYETVSMSFGVKKSIVVPKDSATLGYANERTTYLHANHREVCKYANRDDPNYLAVRNALASTLEVLRTVSAMKRPQTDYEQQRWLAETLDVDDACSDEYQRIDTIRMRGSFESYGEPIPQHVKVISETIPQSNTNDDIGLYLKANIDNIPALGSNKDEVRADTMRIILEKSAGCFLWARLVLQELRRVHTAAEIRQVLEDIPSDMDHLYTRIVNAMSTLSRGNRLAKAILTWTVCSARPMTVDELYHALQIDLDDNIDSVHRSIASTCGQLICVDANSRVQMVHQAARDFLLRPDNASEFAIDKRTGHKRLAMVCLHYLRSSEMAAPKPRKLSASLTEKGPCPFVAYACSSLWEHTAFVPSEDDDFFGSLVKFLSSSNALSWIEYIAKNSDLSRLIQTGKALRYFLQRRARHIIPLGSETTLLDAWAVDLVRLVTKFGRKLSSSPSSIFNLIPPFCPTETAIRRQFASSNRAISVSGLSALTWDDCSCIITQQQITPSALACSDRVFVIGSNDGQIRVYDATTCQYCRLVSHGEAIRMLRFGHQDDVMASAGRASVCIWNVLSWEQLWKFDIEAYCMSLSFVDNDGLLLGVLKNNRLLTWNVATGLRGELPNWIGEFDDDSSGQFQGPIATAFAEDFHHLAIAYRGHDVIVWDIEEERIFDIYGQDVGSLGSQSRPRQGVSTISLLEYSRAPEAGLLAAAGNDGGILVFNTIKGIVQAATLANAKTLVSSPDGLTLACGNSAGTIQLFEFDTLKLLYRIQSEEFGVKDLVFSTDSQRLIDIRGPHCRVWDPPVLIRQEAPEEISDTVSVSTGLQDYRVDDAKLAVHITAFACAENPDSVFCGKVDGSVCVYEARGGDHVGTLLSHSTGVSIISLSYDSQSHILVSADSSSRVLAYQLVSDRAGWNLGPLLSDHRTGAAIHQILCNPGCTRMFLSSAGTDDLWSVEPSNSRVLTTVAWEKRRHYSWTTHPNRAEHLLLVTDNITHIYEWDSLARLTSDTGIQLEGSIIPELFIRSIMPCFDAEVTATTFAESAAPRSKSRLLLWKTSDLSAESQSAIPVPHFQPLADQFDHLIGAFGRRLIFLDHDGWVCSADSQNFDVGLFDRHFFFPADWLSNAGELMIDIFLNGNIVFVLRDEVAIIKRGLQHSEQHHSKGLSKRSSFARSAWSDDTVGTRRALPLR